MTWQHLTVTLTTLVTVMGFEQRRPQPASAAQDAKQTRDVMKLEVDVTWPRLPNGWLMGQVAAVATDRHDHVWIIHRPRSVPIEKRNQSAPAILEFDADGKLVQGWGGPGEGYDWPDAEHGIFIDHQDHVWITGSSPVSTSLTKRSDDMVLKFTRQGKFLL